MPDFFSDSDKSKFTMYVICCHVDQLLNDTLPSSKYDIFIQAGAALTDKRVCKLTDMDNDSPNISSRNQRYSEMSAMYWIGQNIQSEYIGITHYRRRFILSDAEYEAYLEKGFDILTTYLQSTDGTIAESYCKTHYGYDWKILLDTIKELSPDDLEFANEQFLRNEFHPCNMGIFSAEIYKEYCSWIFPILDSLYKKIHPKTDVYQRRDIGFIGERLTSLFIEKKKKQGCKIFEIPLKEYKSNKWTPENECDLNNFDEVFEKCKQLYLQDKITYCRQLVASALKHGGISDKRLHSLAMLFKIALEEQKTLPQTMFEYLPLNWRSNLDTLLSLFEGLNNLLYALQANKSPDIVNMFNDLMRSTNLSDTAIYSICKLKGYSLPS